MSTIPSGAILCPACQSESLVLEVGYRECHNCSWWDLGPLPDNEENADVSEEVETSPEADSDATQTPEVSTLEQDAIESERLSREAQSEEMAGAFYNNAGVLWLSAKRPDRAISAFHQAVRLNSADDRSWYGLAKAALGLDLLQRS